MLRTLTATYKAPALQTAAVGLIQYGLPDNVVELKKVKIFFNSNITGTAKFNVTLEGVALFGDDDLDIVDSDSVTISGLSDALSPKDYISLNFTQLPDSFTYPITFELTYDDGQGTEVSQEYVDAQIASVSGATANENKLVSGGQITRVSDYIYSAANATYLIGGVLYPFDTGDASNPLELDPSDLTFDRIDVICFNTDEELEAVAGTPAANPSKPDLDPATQLELKFVIVTANSTEPGDAVEPEDIYLEDDGAPTEWDTSDGPNWNSDYTVGPRTGTKCIRANAVGNGTGIVLTRPTSSDLADYNAVRFYMLSDGTIGNNKFIRCQFRLAGVVKGNTVTVGQNGISQFGYDSTNTATYQLIQPSIAQFALPAGQLVDEFRIFTSGAGLSFRIDDIQLVAEAGSSFTSGISEADADNRYLAKTSNLSDLTDAPTARDNLGISTAIYTGIDSILIGDSGEVLVDENTGNILYL